MSASRNLFQKHVPPRQWLPLLLLLCAQLSACVSVSYVDDKGTLHTLGFANIAIPHHTTDGNTAKAVTVETLGLGFLRTPAGAGLTLGYAKHQLYLLSGNACVGDARALNDTAARTNPPPGQ